MPEPKWRADYLYRQQGQLFGAMLDKGKTVRYRVIEKAGKYYPQQMIKHGPADIWFCFESTKHDGLGESSVSFDTSEDAIYFIEEILEEEGKKNQPVTLIKEWD